jgi:hypothetical protein
MNRTWLARIGVALLVAAALIAVAGIAYRIGDDGQHAVEIGREVVVGDDGTRTVIVDGWRDGWRGPGFGFLFLPLVVIGVILLFRARRDRWDGPPLRREAELRDWHRRQHVADVPAPPSPGDAPPAPPGA